MVRKDRKALLRRETQHRPRTEIDTSAEAAAFGLASYNSFNVAVTRARYQAVVFTNSVPGLKQAVLSVDEKTSTVENRIGIKMSRLIVKQIEQSRAWARTAEVVRQPSVQPSVRKDSELELRR